MLAVFLASPCTLRLWCKSQIVAFTWRWAFKIYGAASFWFSSPEQTWTNLGRLFSFFFLWEGSGIKRTRNRARACYSDLLASLGDGHSMYTVQNCFIFSFPGRFIVMSDQSKRDYTLVCICTFDWVYQLSFDSRWATISVVLLMLHWG